MSVGILEGCHRNTDPLAVAEKARISLQQQFDTNRPDDHLIVDKIDVVAVAPPKYDGTATLKANGSVFTVPISVTSDGQVALVAADDEKVARGWHQTLSKRLAVMDGKYSDYVLSPDLLSLFPGSLRAARKDFADRLGVIGPIRREGDWYVGSGCVPHDCTGNETAWAINSNTGLAAAVIMSQSSDQISAGKHSFKLFGANLENLPAPLTEWGNGYGMDGFNSAPDVPSYVPPIKSKP